MTTHWKLSEITVLQDKQVVLSTIFRGTRGGGGCPPIRPKSDLFAPTPTLSPATTSVEARDRFSKRLFESAALSVVGVSAMLGVAQDDGFYVSSEL